MTSPAPRDRAHVSEHVYELRIAMRSRSKYFLYALSDRLCAHRLTFELGNFVGELGWKLR
jgi:hypothetical protein